MARWRRARCSRTGRRLGGLMLSMAVCGACSFANDGPNTLGAVDTSDRTVVVDAGLQPRVMLRYNFTNDETKAFSTDVIRLSQRFSSGPDPTVDAVADSGASAEVNVTIGTEARVSVAPAGSGSDGTDLFTVNREVVGLSVEDATSDEVAQVARSAMEAGSGREDRHLVDRRGRSFAPSPDGRPDGAGDGSDGIGNVLTSLGAESGRSASVLVVLPEEAVGVGATWLINGEATGVDDGASPATRVEVLDIASGEDGHPSSVLLAIESVGGELPADGLEQGDRTISGTVEIDLSRAVHQSRLVSLASHVASAEAVLEGLPGDGGDGGVGGDRGDGGRDEGALAGEIRQVVEVRSEVQVGD